MTHSAFGSHRKNLSSAYSFSSEQVLPFPRNKDSRSRHPTRCSERLHRSHSGRRPSIRQCFGILRQHRMERGTQGRRCTVARMEDTGRGDRWWYLSASLAVASEAVFTRTCKAANRVSADAMLRITIVQCFSIRVSSDTLVQVDTTQGTTAFLRKLCSWCETIATTTRIFGG